MGQEIDLQLQENIKIFLQNLKMVRKISIIFRQSFPNINYNNSLILSPKWPRSHSPGQCLPSTHWQKKKIRVNRSQSVISPRGMHENV